LKIGILISINWNFCFDILVLSFFKVQNYMFL
jgi:hypothetical protein